jgi:plastocyanin
VIYDLRLAIGDLVNTSRRFLRGGLTACALIAAALFGTGSMQAATIEIGVFDYFFEPFEVAILTGDTVAWTAYGYGHALVADSREFDSTLIWPGTIPALRTFKHTFHTAGTFPYYSHEYGGPGGMGMSATIYVTGPVTNQLPTQPINLSPTNGAAPVIAPIELRGPVYADGDEGDTHASSQWIVRRASGGGMTYDSGEVIDNGLSQNSRTNFWLPEHALDLGSAYDWQVRYRDSFDGWSDYSALTRFSTPPPLLRIEQQIGLVVLRWPTNSAGFALEQSPDLRAANWSPADLAGSPARINGDCVVSNSVAGEERFYRLAKPPGS